MSTEDSLKHIESIRSKTDQLMKSQQRAENQVAHRLGVDFRAGEIDIDEVARVYARLRFSAHAGWSRRFVETSGLSVSVIQDYLRNRARTIPNGESVAGPYWYGPSPLDREAPAPMRGVSVVYVLFDGAGDVCYVGSSGNLRQRLKDHRRDKKEFIRWVAYSFKDRASAYSAESVFLAQYMPYLNIRRTA